MAAGGRPRTQEKHKAAIVWTLKHDGDIHDSAGRMTAQTLCDRINARGHKITRSNMNLMIRGLCDEGLLNRDFSEETKQTFSITLNEVGDYEDPFDEEDGFVKREPLPRTMRIDRILSDIENLPVPERLMLIGLVIDRSASEIDQMHTRLRTALGDLS